jgi:hypothetical protein
MKKIKPLILLVLVIIPLFISCSSDDDIDEIDDTNIVDTSSELHNAFTEFNEDATDIYLNTDGTEVTIETTGEPNHKTVYWGEGEDLYLEENDVATTPSLITERDLSSSITVDAVPQLASSTTSTQLGTVGVAVSGAYIYNDQEGNGALDAAAVSLDWTGGHIGPDLYHYHLEPKAFSNDDEKLVGILKDGFFIYGRKCNSTGTYPTDLDSSGGHTSTTQHNIEEEYHYHIMNEVYSTTGSYIVFAGPYKGSL